VPAATRQWNTCCFVVGRLVTPAGSDELRSGDRIAWRTTVAKKRSTGTRELIDTGRNKMFAKRNADGTFKEMDDVSRSLSADRRRTARRTVASGHGDQGDRPASGARKGASTRSSGRGKGTRKK
jgi:hypothetical protein